ncbi:hypothetical protein ABID12_001543 [Martelella mangrovi]|uniref:Uncharacterized protein n=1 Tax=Martelella mangrovi TaxID=1397477 RepID=A0ABV2IAI3_9HYPH
MSEDLSKSERGGRTAYLRMGVWYNEETGHIHMTLPNSGWFHTTVCADSKSKRGHPNLYAKLARALKEVGSPGPDSVETD